MVAIVLTATGFILVLGFWLYGNYQGKKQFLLAISEHELFDVMQDFYNDNQEVIEQENQSQRNRRVENFTTLLQQKYPIVNVDTVVDMLDEQWGRRNESQSKTTKTDSLPLSKQKMSRHFISTIVFKSINWSDEVVDSLHVRLIKELKERRIYTPFELSLVTLPKEEDRNREFYRQRYIENKTRAIMIDPGQEKYLEINFYNPTLYLLQSIGWQILASLFLICTLIGTFFSLISTIKKQNQLAELRKSFVNNMTHELKTPVSTVMAAVESIQRYGAQDDKQRMDKYLSISRRELEHLSDMIERVLQVDLAGTQGILLNKSWFDLYQVVIDCANNAQIFSNKNVQINLNQVEAHGMIFADQSHIKNVISNLLDNALKYSDEYVQIDIVMEGFASGYQISIKDNGHGIAESYQKEVFDLFFRVPSGNIHNVKGFGLGLAYVKQIINKHQGTITLTSELGHGASFILFLPKEIQ